MILLEEAPALYQGDAVDVLNLDIPGFITLFGIGMIFKGSHKLKSLPKKGSIEWNESSPKRYTLLTISIAVIFSLGIGVYLAQRFLIY